MELGRLPDDRGISRVEKNATDLTIVSPSPQGSAWTNVIQHRSLG
jgi:hypothetical protein